MSGRRSPGTRWPISTSCPRAGSRPPWRGCGLALTHWQGRYAALDNRCPHQGGPLGEGAIEKGWLRCPWHGYDYDPLTGSPPAGFSDAPGCFPVEVREDGVYVAVEDERPHERTVADVMVETMANWGVTHVFGMVGHSNLGFATPCAARRRRAASPTSASATRARRRSPPRPTASSPGGRRRASPSPGRARPTCSPASTTPGPTALRCWPSRDRCRPRCWAGARSRTSTSPPLAHDDPALVHVVCDPDLI